MFLFIKSLAICLLVASLVYGIFAFSTNITGGDSPYNSACGDSSYCKFQNNASDGNKVSPHSNMPIQWWLGMIFSIIWLFALRLVKYYGR
jgi:hypothetical protein